ncbi:ABC transporter ATP-binding protein [Rhizobium brockwellii]|uniref:ABC transporter ATP-binding protein n=1 Tax=Rhizobium brockwellii TaxID=3019932 RepID=UPI003F9BF614
MTGSEPSHRGISMVFQSYALFPHMTVRQNIDFGLRLAKVPAVERDTRVAKAADILHLQPLLDRKPAALSGGQKQRVAIGRSIVRNPEVFLFDEPLSNLDAALRTQMRVELAELHERLAATMVYVTHDQVEAMTLADQIIVMNAGRIEQVDSPEELYHHPQTIFVTTFIGSPKMNLLTGPIAEERGAATYGIRPEHLSLTEEGGWAARVKFTEYLGNETILYLTSELGELTLRVNGNQRFGTGDASRVTADKIHEHLFDGKGRRIG